MAACAEWRSGNTETRMRQAWSGMAIWSSCSQRRGCGKYGQGGCAGVRPVPTKEGGNVGHYLHLLASGVGMSFNTNKDQAAPGHTRKIT
jgi:hypothetical protein